MTVNDRKYVLNLTWDEIWRIKSVIEDKVKEERETMKMRYASDALIKMLRDNIGEEEAILGKIYKKLNP